MPMPDRDRTSLDIQLRITSAKIRMDIHWGYGIAEIQTMRGEGAQARLAKCDNEQARAQQQKAGHN